MPVGGPFPGIAQHVVQAKRIGLKTAHRRFEGKAVSDGLGISLHGRPVGGGGIKSIGNLRQ